MSDGDHSTEQNPAPAKRGCGAPWTKPELTLLRAGDARSGGSTTIDGVTLS